MSSKLPIVVIGAGPSGLSAATLLARKGMRVIVFDAARAAGGRARSEIEQGYSFNLGAHALYCGGPADRLLSELGVSLSGRTPAFKTPRALLGEELVPLPTSTAGLVGAGWLGLRGRYQLLRTLWRAQRVGVGSLEGVTFARWLDTQVSDPQARLLIEALGRLVSYANAPEQVSAEAILSQLSNATARGVRYLDGGWQSMVAGLTRVALASGVELRVGCAERAVEHRAQQVTGV